MNRENSDFWAKVFPLKLLGAVQDPAKWGDVLELIMKMTGAKAAIITLRDKQTCQIVNDVELERRFHSPLIRGFSQDAIIHYLTSLRTIDPWAAFQRSYYPHHPVQMSRVCPQDSVPDTRFFDWLAALGMTDTIVFELDRMAGYWTAINLFLDHPDSPAARRVMDFAQENQELIRNAWVASQAMSQMRQSKAALLDRAAMAGAATCIVDANGELRDCNAPFRDLMETDAIRLSGRQRKLSFGDKVRVVGLDRWEQHGFVRHSCDAEPLVLLATPLDPDPIFAGKRENHWVLTAGHGSSLSAGHTGEAAPALASLSRQERDLYQQIATGLSVAQAGESIGLKRSRSFEVWAQVKTKLGIRTAHLLRR